MAREALNTPAEIPAELDRWNWGAFFLNWIWGIGNSTFIALLALIPGVNIVMIIVLGLRGSRWAWRNRYWRDAEHFRSTQRKWAIAGLIIWVLGILAAAAMIVAVPMTMKNSDAYRISMDAVRANTEVQNALGNNVTGTFWTSGSIDIQAGGTGSAQLSIPVQGDKNTGTVISKAIRTGGQWDVRLLVVMTEGADGPIVLVNKDNQSIPKTTIGI
ncbi:MULTISPECIES: cytochrome c oxidase assembly factor Coa1 family protein [unclassified Mesorhizobium]|uniref:cytochrome c oxidase assembly factor Coa1 family protein n=1 Tax=unclassified Mesorhizobium TaxID=325217 RepID=UPI0030142443